MNNKHGLDARTKRDLYLYIEAMESKSEQVMAMYKGIETFFANQFKEVDCYHIIRPDGISTIMYIETKNENTIMFKTTTMIGGTLKYEDIYMASIIRLREQIFQKLESIGINVPQ